MYGDAEAPASAGSGGMPSPRKCGKNWRSAAMSGFSEVA